MTIHPDLCLKIQGKVTNIEYGNIDYENVNFENGNIDSKNGVKTGSPWGLTHVENTYSKVMIFLQ